MAYLLVLALFACAELPAAAVRTSEHAAAFDEFIQAYGRPYVPGTREYNRRLYIFKDRFEQIKAKNLRPGKLWTAGVNSLTDRTNAELLQLRGWRRTARLPHSEPVSLLRRAAAAEIPKEVSWRKLNTTSRIKEQGSCGSCWAITAASILEAHHEIKLKEYVPFSAQELVSCVPNPKECGGQGGCEGATVELAMIYVSEHGLSKEDEMPYKATDMPCKKSLVQLSASGDVQGVGDGQLTGGAQLGMSGWTKLPENQMEPLMRAALDGPVGVSVSAGSWSFYNEGVFDDCEKDTVIDHAVMLIGFGEEDETKAKYWTIQNSWGNRWGEHGLIRLLRHDPKTDDAEEEAFCGTDSKPELGSGCKGGPSEVRVCGMCGILYDTVQPHFDAKENSTKDVEMVKVHSGYSNLRSKAA